MNHIEKFNQLAGHYDTPINRQMAQLAVEAIRRLKDETNTQTAADLGCGTGLIGLNLLDAFDSMLFVDGSHKMLEKVEETLRRKNITHASVLQLNIENKLQLPHKMDTLILSLVLHHIGNQAKLIANLYQQLTDGGQLFIIEMEKTQPNQHGVDRAELADKLSAAGFQEIHFETIYDAQHDSDKHHGTRFILSARK